MGILLADQHHGDPGQRAGAGKAFEGSEVALDERLEVPAGFHDAADAAWVESGSPARVEGWRIWVVWGRQVATE